MSTTVSVVTNDSDRDCAVCHWDNPATHFVGDTEREDGYPVCGAHAVSVLLDAPTPVAVTVPPIQVQSSWGLVVLFQRADQVQTCVACGAQGKLHHWVNDKGPLCARHAAISLLSQVWWAGVAGPPAPDPGYITQGCIVCGKDLVVQGVATANYRSHRH